MRSPTIKVELGIEGDYFFWRVRYLIKLACNGSWIIVNGGILVVPTVRTARTVRNICTVCTYRRFAEFTPFNAAGFV